MAGLQPIQAVGGGVLPGVQPVLDFVGVVHSGAFSAVRGTSLAHTCRWHYVSASSSPGPGAHIKALSQQGCGMRQAGSSIAGSGKFGRLGA